MRYRDRGSACSSDRKLLLEYLSEEDTSEWTIVELGPFEGQFSEWILDNLKPKMLYIVDTWSLYDGYKGILDVSDDDKYRQLYFETIERFKGRNNITIVREFGDEFLFSLADKSIDMLWDETNAGSTIHNKHLELGWQKVKVGGYIGGCSTDVDYVKDSYNNFIDSHQRVEGKILGQQYIIKFNPRVALFPGKFQPPHLGHILTILRYYDDYDKIIVGATEGPPRVLTLDETCKILEDVFKYHDKIEVFPIKNTLDDESAIPYLPTGWDIILTGNQYVIDLAKDYKWKCRFVDRTEGIGYSGSELRELDGLRDSEDRQDKAS